MTVEAVKTNRVTRDPSIVEVHASRNGKGLKEVNDGKKRGLSPQQRSQLENNVPKLLRDACGWVCWKFGVSDKSAKIPLDPKTGGLADINDTTTSGTLAEAMNACRHFGADGVGYLMLPIDHLVGVDLDKCRDAATGKITSWAEEVIRRLNSYTEVTPSGRGVRVWVEGKWPYSNNCRSGLGENVDGKIEVYSRNRFFTVTGGHVEGTPTDINRNQAALDTIHKRFWNVDFSKTSFPRRAHGHRPPKTTLRSLKRRSRQRTGKNLSGCGMGNVKPNMHLGRKRIWRLRDTSLSGLDAIKSAWIRCSANRGGSDRNGTKSITPAMKRTAITP